MGAILVARQLSPGETDASGLGCVGDGGSAGHAQIVGVIGENVDDERLGAIADRDRDGGIHAGNGGERGAAEFADQRSGGSSVGVTSRGSFDADVVQSAERILFSHHGDHGVDTEGVRVGAGQVLDTTETFLLSDTHGITV